MNRLVLTLVTSLMLASCGQESAPAPPAAQDASPTGEAAPAEIETPGPECEETNELTAIDDDWDPTCIVVPGGSLEVTNDGEALHNFTIAGAVDVDIQPGKSEKVDVSDATEPVGETYFNCTYHPGMSGFLWVR